MGANMALTTYNSPLSVILSFKLLGRVLSTSDDNWPEVICNVRREQHKWVQLLWVLGQKGADMWTLGVLYTEVFQMLLLYGLETWVMSPHIGKTLGLFHHRMVQRLTCWTPK